MKTVQETEETNEMSEKSIKHQCLATLVVSMMSIGFGMNVGWASTSIVLLTSDESPLPSGKITMDQASWIAALLPVGGCFGNIIYACMVKSFGRKWPLIGLSIPMIIGWSLVFFAKNVYYLYVARLMHGFTIGGIVIVVTIYLIEISSDKIRGVLSSSLTPFGNLGIMIIYTMGSVCDFYTTPLIIIASTVLYAIFLLYFPETPIFLMKQNRIIEAEKSTRFYQNIRGIAKNHELIRIEMEKLKLAVGASDEIESKKRSMKWSNLFSGPGRRAMVVGIVLSSLHQFSGCTTILQYSGFMFEEAESNLSPSMSMIFVSVIQFVGSAILLAFVDRAGRRFFYLFSTIGAAIGLTVLGIYMMLKSWQWDTSGYNWIPLASLSFIIFFATCAISTLPFTVIGEIMPENIKEFGVTFCNVILSISTIISLKSLPLLTETLGFHGTFFLFAAICLSGAIFIASYMPETKGRRNYELIM